MSKDFHRKYVIDAHIEADSLDELRAVLDHLQWELDAHAGEGFSITAGGVNSSYQVTLAVNPDEFAEVEAKYGRR